jgi:hypothetical protein
MNINSNDQNIIQYQISQKMQYNTPFYATRELVESTITPFDHFPYKYFFRGEFDNPRPVVLERTAGYRPRYDRCYKELGIAKACEHPFCWQYACSTIHPCKAEQAINKKQVEFGEEVCESRCNIQDRYTNISP